MEMRDLFPVHPTPHSFRNFRFAPNDGEPLTCLQVFQTMAEFDLIYLPRFSSPLPGKQLSWNFVSYVLGNADAATIAP